MYNPDPVHQLDGPRNDGQTSPEPRLPRHDEENLVEGSEQSMSPDARSQQSDHHSENASGGAPVLTDIDYLNTPSKLDQENSVADFKEFDELRYIESCPICGDKVSGYHYGLQTCESCKGFFKRTVQNKKVYSCIDNRDCRIDKTQRKRCPYCRFQKCLSVGMKLEAVRADRMRGGRNKFGPMYKRDRALKQQVARQRRQHIIAQFSYSDRVGSLPPNFDMEPPDIKPDISALMEEMQMTNATSQSLMMSGGHMNIVDVGQRGGHHSGLSREQTNAIRMYNMNHHPHPHSHPPPPPPPPHSQQVDQQGHGHNHTSQGSYSPEQAPPQPMLHAYPGLPSNGMCVSTNSLQPPVSPVHHVVQPMFLGLPPAPPPSVPPLMKELQSHEPSESEVQNRLDSVAMLDISVLHEMNLVIDLDYPDSALTVPQTDADSSDISRPLLRTICKMCDQNLFLLVEWARKAHFFKHLKVEDQMKLIQHSWCDLLLLGFTFRQTKHTKTNSFLIPSGHMVKQTIMDCLGLSSCKSRFQELLKKFRNYKIDDNEYICLKYLILLNPDVPDLINRQAVEESQEKVNTALLEYCTSFYPDIVDKFGQLLVRLPEIRLMGLHAEEYLYYRHLSKDVPDKTLLMEMIHSRRK